MTLKMLPSGQGPLDVPGVFDGLTVAIRLEDQTFSKRCGHLHDRMLIPALEMAGKIKAVADARVCRDTLIGFSANPNFPMKDDTA